jgi:hypothetical protein
VRIFWPAMATSLPTTLYCFFPFAKALDRVGAQLDRLIYDAFPPESRLKT